MQSQNLDSAENVKIENHFECLNTCHNICQLGMRSKMPEYIVRYYIYIYIFE